VWHLPVDAAAEAVCNPSSTLCIGDRAVELVLWNPVAENVLALASQQSVKIYDVQRDDAAFGNLCFMSYLVLLHTVVLCITSYRTK